GDEDFNEVVFEDCVVSEENLVGAVGNGWEQVTSELGYERSGPERFLSAFRVFVEFVRYVGASPSDEESALIGRLASHIMTLRQMSISVAAMLQAGKNPATEAALVKSLGNDFEKTLPELVRLFAPRLGPKHPLRCSLEQTLLHSPSFTIRGGTREILRGVIARGLGLR
ncbi:MAG: acyl-CoA dehydrogenase family protein, partial [Pseudomonadota bacterium]|nr:acyl-CoA dehydrogenase family protein [Pseudomonadota bacterium]